MRPQSAKAKGRRFQQFVRDALLEAAQWLEPDDVRSNPMGADGEDILFSPAARQVYPYSFECKNVEKFNVWKAIEQARDNSSNHIPAVVFTKNREEPMIAIPFQHFLELIRHG